MTKKFEEIPHLKIFSITWNMAGNHVDYESLERAFRKDEVKHDIYVFAS